MKKALSLILALVMCLSLCACGNSNSAANADSYTLDHACMNANKLVHQWDSENYIDCSYEGKYYDNYTGMAVPIYAVSVRYPSWLDSVDAATYVKTMATKTLSEELYPQLKAAFGNLNVSVLFILSDQSGYKVFSAVLDGTIEYY